MKTLFVYYKVMPAEHGALQHKAFAFQQQLQQRWPSMQMQLMQRPELSSEGLETWMEVYQHPQGVTDEMIQSISAVAAAMAMPPKRFTEVFVPLQ